VRARLLLRLFSVLVCGWGGGGENFLAEGNGMTDVYSVLHLP